ncbi:hypothetical protein MD484_g7367, partial [Candolleomyces efflorescens]
MHFSPYSPRQISLLVPSSLLPVSVRFESLAAAIQALIDYLFSDKPGTTTAFPDDFRMISGSAALRTYDSKSYAQQAVTFLCLNFHGQSTRHNELPSGICPDGIRAQINFPSCWDGKNTDSADHKSHVAFPSGGPDSGTCSDPKYPKTLPRIFLEVYWASTAFDSVRNKAMNPSQPFVYAHGDPTGYGYHADFVNGWERGVLQNAVDKCHCNPYGDPTCCVDQGIFSMNHGKTCRITKAIDETTTGTLSKLPGNNPVIGQGVAIPQPDSVTPALLGPIYAYEGERPTATGKVTAAAVTSKPMATQVRDSSVAAVTTTAPVAAASDVKPAPVVKPLAPNFSGAPAASSTVRAPASTPKVKPGRSQFEAPPSEPVVAASQPNAHDVNSGQNVATDGSEGDEVDSKSCSSLKRKDKLVKLNSMPSHFKKASNIAIGEITNISANQYNHYAERSPKAAIEKLREYIAAGALHNSAERCDAPKCHPETRVAVQDEVISWIYDGDCDGEARKMMWLTGPAGTGKTAVMGSVADTCHRKGILGASHFFSSFSGSANRRSKQFLVPTLAYQLVQHKTMPQFRERILSGAVEQNPVIFEQNIEVQLDQLILEPLRSCRDHTNLPEAPKVILIDGLDECEAEQYHDTGRANVTISPRPKEDDHTEILYVLKKAAGDPSFPFRIVIASRPEHSIKQFFTDVAGSMTRELFLDEKYNPDADMDLYLESKFSNVRRRCHLPTSWPSAEVRQTLLANASGQFIYVSTIGRFIEGEGNPDHLLNQVLQLPGAAPSTNPFAPLDALYNHILSSDPDPHIKMLWLSVLFRRGLLKYSVEIDRKSERFDDYGPFSSWAVPSPATAALARLFLESYPGEASHVFRNLNSLVPPPSADGGRYTLYHKSLADFLTDQHRSGELYVESAVVLDFFVDRYMMLWENKGPRRQLTLTEEQEFFSLFFSEQMIRTIFTSQNLGRLNTYISSCDVAWWMQHWLLNERSLDSPSASELAYAVFRSVHATTCKYYHLFIEKSARNIWRNCLRQQCIENEVFWPSFKDLSLASEFKDACTTPLQVVKTYETALKRQHAALAVFPRLTDLEFPEGLEGDDIQEIFLVPGGRFLLTLQQSVWLCIWDMARDDSESPQEEDNLRLKLVLRHPISNALEKLVFIDAVVDTSKIRLLAKLRSGIPQEVASSMNLVDENDRDVFGYQYLELDASGETWVIRELGHLTVIYPDDDTSSIKYNTFGEEKIIFHANSATFVWDFVHDHFSMWRLDDLPQINDVFSYDNFMFYLGIEGIFGLERPPFVPVESNCIVVPSPSTPNTDTLVISPAFSIPHQRNHENVDRVSGPDSCNNRIRSNVNVPVIYEITETEPRDDLVNIPDGTGDSAQYQPRVTTIYRYRFQFDALNPSRSKLDLIEVSTVHKTGYTDTADLRQPLILNPQPYSLSNGRLSAVWTDDYEDPEGQSWRTVSLFLSLSTKFDPTPDIDYGPVDPPDNASRPEKAVTDTELRLLRICDVRLDDEDDDQPLSALAFFFNL